MFQPPNLDMAFALNAVDQLFHVEFSGNVFSAAISDFSLDGHRKADTKLATELKMRFASAKLPTLFSRLADLCPKAIMGWSFYDADETGVDKSVLRGSDLVVFHTQYCSHQITEGALRKTRTYGVPVGYAYKVNPPAFFAEVVTMAKNLLVGRSSGPTANA